MLGGRSWEVRRPCFHAANSEIRRGGHSENEQASEDIALLFESRTGTSLDLQLDLVDAEASNRG